MNDTSTHPPATATDPEYTFAVMVGVDVAD